MQGREQQSGGAIGMTFLTEALGQDNPVTTRSALSGVDC